MWHSSRVSALRRGPNSHEGGKSAWSRAGQRVGTRSPEELTQDAPTSLSMAPIWQRRSHPVARGARCGDNRHPQPGQRLGQRPRTKQRLLTVSTETKPSSPTPQPLVGRLASGAILSQDRCIHRHALGQQAQRCLTLRSTGPATASTVSLVRGTWCIIAYQAYGARLRGPVSSNVRHRRASKVALQQSQRLAA